MRFTPTELPGVILVEPDVHRDPRGFFLESYHQAKYAKGGIDTVFVQDNHSASQRGTLRGLHSQIEHAQDKLVRAVEGEIFDVAVDIRVGSPTFGRWTGVTLSADNFKQLYVPKGFAHGFCVLSETAQVEYKVTNFYHPEHEIVVQWNDPAIGIRWPIEKPLLSARDQAGKPLSELKGKLPKT
jgi:dTDP-4-dehydrorhamnose 3,5-epimerase